MKEKTLKEEVLGDIRDVYKKGDIKYTISHYVPLDFWVKPFKKLFSDMYIDNRTDINYSICFKISINLSPIKKERFSCEFNNYIKKHGLVDLLVINISMIAPYATVEYVQYRLVDGDCIPFNGYIPFNKEHAKYGEAVKKYLLEKNVICLEDDILFEKVDNDISLELRTRDVRVYNCLFNDVDGWPK